MNRGNLTIYLEDHIAGSVAALELLADLVGHDPEVTEVAELKALRDEIEADQQVLKDLLQRLDTQESNVKKAGAWVAEKMLRAKLQLSSDLGMLEALEVLGLGIEGKLRLWRALAGLDLGLDLPHLESKAVKQGQRVEALRLASAQRAFA